MTTTTCSIQVRCSCGARASVPEGLAGRKLRCRGCKQTLRVPRRAAAGVSREAGSGSGQRWLQREPAEDLVVLTPLAVADTDELMLLPPEERRALEPPAPRGRRERGPKRELVHEGHLRAIGLWHGLGAALALVASLLGALALGSASKSLGLALVVLASGGLFVGLSAAAAVGLWQRRGYGRWVSLALTVLGLLGALAGVARGSSGLLGSLPQLCWNVAILWALTCPQASAIFAPSYRAVVERTERLTVRWWSSPFFYVPVALLLLGLLLLAGGLALAIARAF